MRESSFRLHPSQRLGMSVALTALFATAPSASHANTLETLQSENAALRTENAALRKRIEALEGKLDPSGQTSSAPLKPGTARTEGVFVPRSRVSLRVTRDAGSGATSLASRWYRTSPGGLLPQKEWMQVRARQSPSGEITGAWLLVEREGGSGSFKAATGRLDVDGRPIEVRLEDYDRSEDRRSAGKVTTTTRRERVQYALPPAAIGDVARASTARFEAGAVDFELTDEQLAAFAAIDVRTDPSQAAVKPASAR